MSVLSGTPVGYTEARGVRPQGPPQRAKETCAAQPHAYLPLPLHATWDIRKRNSAVTLLFLEKVPRIAGSFWARFCYIWLQKSEAFGSTLPDELIRRHGGFTLDKSHIGRPDSWPINGRKAAVILQLMRQCGDAMSVEMQHIDAPGRHV